ncbi:carotenoid oxygenase family protein [Halobacterium wangiae]|uniref:carotenoid oxygenase family protein n=1 Tax=Halobacterium wangiae TaxID=2902623 RepID=UPI001E63AF14|nr:carotenoid oxygenase family protein [Halobacterium wangiae]
MADYRIGFESCETEYAGVDLPVEGSIPAWLDGALLRNGPGKFGPGEPRGGSPNERATTAGNREQDGERFAHWFDGLALLRKFAVHDGSVTYTNRFLRTAEYRSVVEDGGLGAGQFGTNATPGFRSRLKSAVLPESTDNANVNVMRAGDAFLALTEVPERVAFDPRTLETEGSWRFDDDHDGHMACAHPVVDPETGATFDFSVRFGRHTDYVVTRLPAGETTRDVVGTVSLSDAVYVHSFALTPDHVVLVACPLVVDVLGLLRPGGHDTFLDALDWRPDRAARFVVLSRETGDIVSAPTAPPFFTFHHANAFRRGDDLVVDLVAFSDASVVTELSLSDLDAGSVTELDGDLRRYRVPLDGERTTQETLASGGLSLPRFDERHRGRPYRYAYATRSGGRDAPNHLVRVDCWTGETRVWEQADAFCGEPVVVPRPGGEEGDGVVLSVVLDAAREQSFLLVLDAGSFEEVARAWTPHVLPFDFHGQFYPGLA